MKKLFAVAMLALAVPTFAADAKAADKSAKKPADKPADKAAADAGTAAPAK